MKTILTFFLFLSLNNFLFAQEIDKLISEIFDIEHPSLQNKAMRKLISQKVNFDTLYQKLSVGKIYSQHIETGWIEKTNLIDSLEFYFLAYIPKNYDSSKKYSLRFMLHGGVSTRNAFYPKTFIDKNNPDYEKLDYIVVYPASWFIAPWWSLRQYKHIEKIVNFFKVHYNIDENKIYLSGISDGATGVFYFANLNQTKWASFATYIGYCGALRNISKQQIYISNYKNKFFFIQNGLKDLTFRFEEVKIYLDLLKSARVDMKLLVVDTCGHSLNWYPVYKDSIKHFLNTHPRHPFPDKLNWSTEFEEDFNRCYWLNILKISKMKSEKVCIPDFNIDERNFLYKFRRETEFGTIFAEKKENSVFICTNNIKKFSILLSPSHFNFNEKVKIYLNDNLIFEDFVKKDISVLLHWAKNDIDRQMLFGSEIKIKTGKKPSAEFVTY